MSHPSACGVSADDVAVLVHDDLLAIKAHNGILEFRRDKFCVHGCSPFLTPKWCGCCNAGYG